MPLAHAAYKIDLTNMTDKLHVHLKHSQKATVLILPNDL